MIPTRPRRSLRLRFSLHLALSLMVLGPAAVARADALRVLPPNQLPKDKRLGKLKTLNDYFPFHPPATLEAWAKRSERLRRQVLVAVGMWPMPTKTPAHAVVHGEIDREDYTVWKVFLESFPGHFVTGNLYRPKGYEGRRPGVLCPHGHWPGGRFCDRGPKKIRWDLINGAERFELAGRFPLQARCVQLARMGCVVFHYDMIAYADSVQLDHRAGSRPEMDTPENWGYFSPRAEARLQHIMGLQTYNSARALDWLCGLPDVDPKRIAITGASGGATQTFILSAIDPRPVVAFPAVMVSTAMQGGCPCENASYLRLGTGNIEIAALYAPRPLGMTAADDSTKQIATKGLPELKQLYKMFDAEEFVMARPLVHFPHNYNYVSRAVMYHWLNEHLKLGLEEPIVEEDFQPLSVAEMSVWDEAHPKPPAGDDYERSLLKWITENSDQQMAALAPTDRESLAAYREVIGGAVDVMIGRGVLEPGAVECIHRHEEDLGRWRLSKLLLRYTAEEEELPVIMLRPRREFNRVVVWIDKLGKQGLFDKQPPRHGQSDPGRPGDDPSVPETSAGSPRWVPKPEIEKLLAAGVAVVGVDLFGQGEFTTDGKPIAGTRLNESGCDQWAKYAGYTFGYNYPVFSKRVHDVLTVVSYIRNTQPAPEEVDLVGLAGAGHWVAAARARAGTAVDRAVIDTAGFRFAKLTSIDDPDFLPGGAKYLDLPGILALSAPQPTWLAGEGAEPSVVAEAYRAAGKDDQLTVFVGEGPDKWNAAIEWLFRTRRW